MVGTGFCKNCKQLREIYARFLCAGCYQKKKNEGKLDMFPIKLRHKPCRECKKVRPLKDSLCRACRTKKKTLGINIGNYRNVTITGPSKEQIEAFLEKEKQRIYEDLKKNPRKYLDRIK